MPMYMEHVHAGKMGLQRNSLDTLIFFPISDPFLYKEKLVEQSKVLCTEALGGIP